MDATTWDERYAAAPRLWSEEPNRLLVEQVAGLLPGRALDVGCGEGRNAIWLAERGWAVTGVDFSAVALGKARRWAVERQVEVTWRQVDVAVDPLPDGGFELALMLYLQLAAAARARAIAASAGAVAPGGTLLVVAHDTSNLEHGYGGPRDQAVLYGPDDVAADLPADFEIGAARCVERPVDTPDGRRIAIDTLVRATRRAGGGGP